MGGAGIRWSDVRHMLDTCAQGWSERLKLHHRWISYGARTWVEFPKGSGTGGRDYEVRSWQVRRMIQHLGIDAACARAKLGSL